jgi:hypothetical protein
MLLALILACVVLPPQVRAVRGALHLSRRAEVLSRETRDLAGAWTRSGARVVVWGGFSWQALRPFDPLDKVRDFHPAMLGVTQQESAWPRLQAWTGDPAVWPALGKADPIHWILPGGNMGAERAAWLGDFLQRRAGISLVPREETPPEIPRSGARVLRWMEGP